MPARRRRGVPRGTRRVRALKPRLDWVYHADSYANGSVTVDAGFLNAATFTLVDSQQALRFIRYGGVQIVPNAAAAAASTIIGEWERPREARIKVHAVEWLLLAEPTTWTLGNNITWGMRLGSYEQDPYTGLVGVPPYYGIWNTPVVTDGTNAAGIANDHRRAFREWRNVEIYNSQTSTPVFRWRGSWRGRWTMPPDEQIALYFELLTGSASVRVRTYCRSLLEIPRSS